MLVGRGARSGARGGANRSGFLAPTPILSPMVARRARRPSCPNPIHGRLHLRVRPAILRGVCEPYNSTQHKSDHRQDDKGEVATREVLIVFCKAPAATKPAISALNDPALRQYVKAPGGIRTFDYLKWNAGLSLHLGCSPLTLVAAIGNCLLERWKTIARNFQERRDGVAVLHVAGRNHDVDQHAERIDRRMALLPLDFLARVISSRINLSPPFSALFTVWLSTIASVGVSDLPSSARTSA